jgi:hypothetical protein
MMYVSTSNHKEQNSSDNLPTAAPRLHPDNELMNTYNTVQQSAHVVCAVRDSSHYVHQADSVHNVAYNSMSS